MYELSTDHTPRWEAGEAWQAHDAVIRDIHWHVTSRILATCSLDLTVKLWTESGWLVSLVT